MLKSGARFVAFASGPLGKEKLAATGTTLVIGVVAKKESIEGILSFSVAVNGTDATESIIKAIKLSRFGSQIRVVVLNGIALAGLNVVNIGELAKNGFEVMVITRHKPRPSKLLYALKMFSKKSGKQVGERIEIVKEFAKKKPERISGFYIQSTMQKSDYMQICNHAISALRLAHLIASGISKGESKGRV